MSHRRKKGKRPSKATSRSPSPQITTPEPVAPVQQDRVSAALAPVMPYWNKLQSFLAHGDRILAKLRFPTLSPRYERWFGPNALLWIAILSILPIIYVGFGLTVSVTGYGWPRNLPPWIDNDYWWHLATGNWIIDKREMPSPDPWLFTYDGKFVAHEWLGEIFLSVTDRIGDYPAGIIATWLIAIAGFYILVAAMHVYGLSWRGCTIASVLWMGVFLRDGVFAVRPQMWTFTFYALLFFFLARYETGRTNRLWVLPPFFLIWFNTHLSAVIGILVLGLFGLDQLIRRKPVRHLIIVGVLCLAGMVVNPFGLDYVDQIFRFGGRPDIWNERIFEWQEPVLRQRHNWGFALSIPMVVPAVWQLLRGRIWPGTLVIFFVYQAQTSVRFVTVYVLFCMIFTGWLVWQHRQDYAKAWAPAPARVSRASWPLAVPAAVAAVVVLVVAVTYENSQFQRNPVAWGYPVEAAAIYKENYDHLRLFNTYDWGGYLDLQFNGDPEIFIDGRADTYPNELIEEYFWMVDGRDGWDAMMNRYDIGVIMIRPRDGLNIPLQTHPDWVQIYNQPYWDTTMYVRRSAIDSG